MDRELLVILMRLVKVSQEQAAEQVMTMVKWQTRLALIEGALLKLATEDVTTTLAKAEPAGSDDVW